MNSAGLNLKIVLFKRRNDVAESKPSTGRISKAKAKEIELAQEVEAQRKQARQKKTNSSGMGSGCSGACGHWSHFAAGIVWDHARRFG